VVYARYYQQQAVATSESLSTVISTLQQFNPTYVTTFIALNAKVNLTSNMIADWSAARAALPNAKFDLMLYAAQYPSLSSVQTKINTLNQQFIQAGTKPPDVWLFDYLGEVYPQNPAMWDQVIDYALSTAAFASATSSAGIW
jgi:predicted Zn-dependent protease